MFLIFTLITCLLSMIANSQSDWTLQDDYGTDSSFFNQFTFFTDHDPTNGYVTYLDQLTALQEGLVSAVSSSVRIGVDSTNAAIGNGRKSVRIASKNTYNVGTLVIIDLAHMPANACGSWPAFWMLGPSWPTNGEIDIIENVNMNTQNQMTLHTDDDCTVINVGSGSWAHSESNCNAFATAENYGCGVKSNNTDDFGDGFNAKGGGVYAMEWTNKGINIWYWAAADIAPDIKRGQPEPSKWGTPNAGFSGRGCDFASRFKNMQIIFDITFCGDWAGSDASCSGGATCHDYVANNPDVYSGSYWDVKSLKVYTQQRQSPANPSIDASPVKSSDPSTSTARDEYEAESCGGQTYR